MQDLDTPVNCYRKLFGMLLLRQQELAGSRCCSLVKLEPWFQFDYLYVPCLKLLTLLFNISNDIHVSWFLCQYVMSCRWSSIIWRCGFLPVCCTSTCTKPPSFTSATWPEAPVQMPSYRVGNSCTLKEQNTALFCWIFWWGVPRCRHHQKTLAKHTFMGVISLFTLPFTISLKLYSENLKSLKFF